MPDTPPEPKLPSELLSAAGRPIRLAYLVGNYPAVSVTFILREILGMQELGFDILPASVNQAAPSASGFSPVELAEQARTFYITSRPVLQIATDHLSTMLTKPARYWKGFLHALRLGSESPRKALLNLAYFAEGVVLGKWMERQGLHHVHVHFGNASVAVALLAGRVFGHSYSISIHGPDEFYGVAAYHLREKVADALFVRCISFYCRSQLMFCIRSEDWPKLQISRLGVDTDRYKPSPRPARDMVRILFVGRLVMAKAPKVLLEAAAILRARNLNFHMSLVGDGPERKTLEAQIQQAGLTGCVTLHGSLNQEKVLELLDDTDVFTLPSFAEGIPVSLMEAMAKGIPCVSTVIAGIPELIDSGINGILVPPSSAELLAEALGRLVESPALRAEFAAAGRAKVERDFHLKTNMRGLALLFANRLERGA